MTSDVLSYLTRLLVYKSVYFYLITSWQVHYLLISSVLSNLIVFLIVFLSFSHLIMFLFYSYYCHWFIVCCFELFVLFWYMELLYLSSFRFFKFVFLLYLCVIKSNTYTSCTYQLFTFSLFICTSVPYVYLCLRRGLFHVFLFIFLYVLSFHCM